MLGSVKGATDNYAKLVEVVMKGSKEPGPLQKVYSRDNPAVQNKMSQYGTFDVGSYVSDVVGTGKGKFFDVKA